MGKEQINLVVTGATSFLGTALVLELLALCDVFLFFSFFVLFAPNT